ncbi:MAG: YicC family protein [Lachnospiraceae bacterium]|nr:YicC family protein [Lachnospiraceae bacterium]
MIKSMTGFGRGEVTENDLKFTVELKSVNHRYLDMNVKLPKSLNFFESAIRQELKNYISRGKVDVYVTYENLGESSSRITYHKEVAEEYLSYMKQMSEDFGLENDVRVAKLASMPDVLVMEEEETDEEELWKALKKAVDIAAEGFVKTREAEGERLKEDLLGKLDTIAGLVAFIEERSPQIVTEYRERIQTRVCEILGDTQVDEGRLLTEVTVFADKVCVDEEIVRLKSHIDGMKKELTDGGSIGRKLDFITQEMNREANTTLSKTTDLEISNRGIELKTEIEKVREQIQNIE